MLEFLTNIPSVYLYAIGALIVLLLIIGILNSIWTFIKIAALISIVLWLLTTFQPAKEVDITQNLPESVVTQICVMAEL